MISALKCTFVLWLYGLFDTTLNCWGVFQRPLVAGTLTGLLLGDLRTGVMMGATIEGIYMGVSNVGGAAPSEPCSATIISVAFSILTGADVSAGIALAVPIGTLMQQVNNMFFPVWGSLAPYWERLASSGNTKKYKLQLLLFDAFIGRLPSYIIMFLSIAFGIEGLQIVFSKLPDWLLRGLSATSSMMAAVGFANLIRIIWSNEIGAFFFVGYIFAKYLHLDTLPIAILLGVVAIYTFYIEKKNIEMPVLAESEETKDE